MLHTMNRYGLLFQIVRQVYGKKRRKVLPRYVPGNGPYRPAPDVRLVRFESDSSNLAPGFGTHRKEIKPVQDIGPSPLIRSGMPTAKIFRAVFGLRENGKGQIEVFATRPTFREIDS